MPTNSNNSTPASERLPDSLQGIAGDLQDHFDDPYHRGDCETATHAAQGIEEQSKCAVRIELSIGDDAEIIEAWWEGQGCVLCEGASSMLVERVEGQSVQDLEGLVDGFMQQDVSQEADVTKEVVVSAEPATNCLSLPGQTLLKALKTPLKEVDGDLTDGTQFGGPSLREEC